MASQPQQPHSQEHTMKQAGPQPQEKVSRGFTAVNQSYLTPPNDIHHSFSTEEGNDQSQAWEENRLPPLQERSPPVSPETRVLPSINTLASSQSTDPPLYPDDPSYSSQHQAPLFTHHRGGSQGSASPRPSSSVRVKAQSAAASTAHLWPQNQLVHTPLDALVYWRDRMAEHRSYRAAVLPDPKSLKRADRGDVDERLLAKLRLSNPSKITKTKAAPKPSPKVKAAVPMTASPSTTKSTQRKRTPKARTEAEFISSAFPNSQHQSKHTRAAPSKKVENDKVHWSELPDYCPPLSTLDDPTKKLEARWAHGPLDIEGELDLDQLHPKEIVIAQKLRLKPNEYLQNKRKIFAARLQSIKDGKNFTKTAAQGACGIDVNKASQLWEAFDKVGWFKESWFEKWMT